MSVNRDTSKTFERTLNTTGMTTLREGLVGEYAFGIDEETSVKNMADPTKPLTPVNAPGYSTVYGDSYATLRGHATIGHGFRTGITLERGATIVLISSHWSGITHTMVGLLSTTSRYGFGTWGTYFLGYGGHSGVGTGLRTDFSAFNGSAWANGGAFVAVRMSDPDAAHEGPNKYANGLSIKGGVATPIAAPDTIYEIKSFAAPSTTDAMTVYLGGPDGYSSTSNTAHDVRVQAMLIWQRPLTDAELGQVYLEVKAWLATNRGGLVQ